MKKMRKIIKCLMMCFLVTMIFESKAVASEILSEQPIPDYLWYGEGSGTEYIVSDVDDLIGFANIVNGTAEGIEKDTFLNKTVTLKNNIDLTGIMWTPIGSSMYVHSPEDDATKRFEGNFDGSNCIIKGLNSENYIPASSDVGAGEYSFGFFGYVHGANIKNVKLSEVDIEGCDKEVDEASVGGSGVAALVGYYVPMDDAKSIIENCHVIDGNVKATNNMGGLIGYLEVHGSEIDVDLKIRKCTNAATVITEAREAGGILGLLNIPAGTSGDVKFESCINTGDITAEDGGSSSCAGGILGRDNSSGTRKFTVYFENCVNSGKITVIGRKNSEVHCSGIGNVYYSSGSFMVARNCTNLGEIVVDGIPGDIYAGQIFGYVPTRILSTCYNNGSITKPDEKIRVTYDSNGADFLTAYNDVDKNKEITISNSTATPIRDGYTFLGWNTKADGTGVFYKNGEKITLTDSIILYAQWGKMKETWGVLALANEIYTGKEIKPTIVVIDNLGEVILEGYEIVYSDNIVDVGIVSVTVKYNNEIIEMTFEILKDEFPTIKVEDVSANYDTEISISAKAYTSAENEILGDNILELMYYVDSECNIKLDAIPENAGIYYVKAKLIETTNYAETTSSEPAVIEIKKITPKINISILDWTYGEKANIPDVIENTSNGTIDFYYKKLDADDSEYTAEVPQNAGKYILKAVVEESDNYKEVSTTVDFCINHKNLSDSMITLDNSIFEYDGTVRTPQITVTDVINEREKILIEGTDYTLDVDSENSGDEVKEYVIKISGIGNYCGLASSNWKIVKPTFDVSLILNDGILNEENITKYTEGTTTRLPTNIQKSGYSFGGWYDNEQFLGKAITEISENDSGDKVFYAKWIKRNSSSVKKYSIDIEIQGCGRVEVNDKTPLKNQIVSIDVIPDDGYELKYITVSNEDGTELDVINDGEKYKFKQNNDDVIINVLFEKCNEEGEIETTICSCSHFKDVSQDGWYHDAIDYVVENDIMNGVSNEKFDLNSSTTRAMFITIIWRIENSPSVDYLINLDDVESDMWYTEAIRWALFEKIVEGYNNGKMGCNDSITREQMITILYRYANYKNKNISGENETSLNYNDMDEISNWANEAFMWAVKNEIINGRTETTLVPQGITTRAETATMIMRFCNMISEI